jgi:hypothetical protein
MQFYPIYILLQNSFYFTSVPHDTEFVDVGLLDINVSEAKTASIFRTEVQCKASAHEDAPATPATPSHIK